MKNNNFFERPHIQTSFHTKYSQQPHSHSQRDYSHDRNITRISPAPQDRLSHVPGPAVYPGQRYQSNDYQLGPRISQFHLANSDSSKLVLELLQRVEKLEAKNDRWERLEIRTDRIEANSLKIESKIQKVISSRERTPKGKENMMSLQNRVSEEQPKSKLRNDFVTKEELQKQLSGLDGAFKNLFSTFRTTINAEVGQYNTKNKKKFIEITATQLSQKLQHFKSNFLKEWNTQIENIVKDTWSQQSESKTVMGISKQKFLGTATPIKFKEELSAQIDSKDKQLITVETRYYVDDEGFLLDKNMHYLLNAKNQQIKLDEARLQMLRKEGLLLPQEQKSSLTKSLSAS